MKPARQSLDHVRGDSETITLTLTDGGAPLDLTPYDEISFLVFDEAAGDTAALITKTLSGGGGVTVPAPATDGIVEVALVPADSSGISMTKEILELFWALRLEVTGAGQIQTPVRGEFRLLSAGFES